MLVVMRPDATEAEIAQVVARARALGLEGHPMPGAQRTAIGLTGNEGPIDPAHFQDLPGVRECISVSKPYKLVSREGKDHDTVIDLGTTRIGGGGFTVMAGPCAVESREQTVGTARAVARAGATLLRGGAFKPRTSPYSFQGLKEEGLKILAEAREATGLPVITEVKDTETLDLVARYADVLQIGARNMQNFSLLEAVGRVGKPVMLKRGLSARLEEFLMAAEYILSRGNLQVVLCERGIRTFETMTRNTLDLSAVAVLKQESHLPVIVDPSHGTGRRDLVIPLARAAAAVGADGIMVEVHPNPSEAKSDGPQALTPDLFEALMQQVQAVRAALCPSPEHR
ncbi:MAG: 3-deoxy-7-phosphoheptulonate synthase [Deltaproteobacteria bacterium]|nr:MAG: 3-deoxy-7-phosphoheptulonate synthase [Deltaproteobacteria bacterium]